MKQALFGVCSERKRWTRDALLEGLKDNALVNRYYSTTSEAIKVKKKEIEAAPEMFYQNIKNGEGLDISRWGTCENVELLKMTSMAPDKEVKKGSCRVQKRKEQRRFGSEGRAQT